MPIATGLPPVKDDPRPLPYLSTMFSCSHCNGIFTTMATFDEHCSKRHGSPLSVVFENAPHERCHWRDRKLISKSPEKATQARKCGSCDIKCITITELQIHQRAQNHCYCEECDKFFATSKETVKHFGTALHASEYTCCDCSRSFRNEDKLYRHLEHEHRRQLSCQVCLQVFGAKKVLDQHIASQHQADPKKKREILPQSADACYICQKKFSTINALQNHLQSPSHHPISELRCFASVECKGRFSSPSALLGHLESGQCCSGIKREFINDLVQTYDTDCVITGQHTAQKLLDHHGPGSDLSSPPGSPVLTPNSSSWNSPYLAPTSRVDDNNLSESTLPLGPSSSGTWFPSNVHTPLSPGMLAPASSWRPSVIQLSINQYPLSCPLCSKNKRFKSKHALESHMSSPAHMSKIFHCPTNLMDLAINKTIIKSFTTLSGLTQHIESASCGDGKATLKAAMEIIQGKLETMGLGRIKLLK